MVTILEEWILQNILVRGSARENLPPGGPEKQLVLENEIVRGDGKIPSRVESCYQGRLGRVACFVLCHSTRLSSGRDLLAGTVTLNGVAYSFNAALECLGDVVKDVIYSTLEGNGIGVQDISLRIPDVIMILRKTVGGGAELIVHKMLAEFRSECFKARTRYARENNLLADIHLPVRSRAS